MDAKILKKQLLNVVATVKPPDGKYWVGAAMERDGYTVLRLRPYLVQSNSTHLGADQEQRCSPKAFEIDHIEKLLNEVAEKVTFNQWRNVGSYVVYMKVMFKQGGVTSAHINHIVIALDLDGTSSDSDLSGVEPVNEP